MFELNSQNTMFNEIDKVLACKRIDEMMFAFIHLYEQIPENLVQHLGLDNVWQTIAGKLYDNEFRQRVEFYYSVTTGEEGRLYFDPDADFVSDYIFDKELYEQMTQIRMELSEQLGKIKKALSADINLDFGGGE